MGPFQTGGGCWEGACEWCRGEGKLVQLDTCGCHTVGVGRGGLPTSQEAAERLGAVCGGLGGEGWGGGEGGGWGGGCGGEGEVVEVSSVRHV